ncbi:SCO family protein [Sphingomonas sp. So64.6b]|uniref:SCO family protein n=1 Tax=Sphingomonas sp. So64.6b TaxID=2997354 RepID=UPI00160216D8|nr:SCO family protein [Sphingomonas sp. So64.6b]QNA85832.1 SCO family protein [Sphingomonas sp. So64.6b]
MADRAMKLIARTLAMFLIAALLAACSGPSALPRAPLEGAAIGGPFTLTDQDGRQVSDTAYKGKYRIVYFGYTFCPDVCPVDVQNLGAGLRLLEKSDPGLGAKIVPIFISVDPERDTPAALKQFVSAFHPRMVGLTGSPEAIAKVAKAFAIYYKKGDPAPGGGYLMDHSRVAYLMDPDGKPLALLPQDGKPEAIAIELKRWVK